jgi:hypothetical protein
MGGLLPIIWNWCVPLPGCRYNLNYGLLTFQLYCNFCDGLCGFVFLGSTANTLNPPVLGSSCPPPAALGGPNTGTRQCYPTIISGSICGVDCLNCGFWTSCTAPCWWNPTVSANCFDYSILLP